KPTMRERYDALVVDMKREYGIRVRKWRSSSSGVAWEVHYRDGRITRLIESPYPRGPMSCAIFLHEIGHHAIGLGTYRVRCLEEYHAWKWSLDTMRERDFNVTASVENRMHDALHYAVQKAMRRGLKRLPVELTPYLQPRLPRVIDINIIPKHPDGTPIRT
ncbi:MAG: hypothetical protein KC983_11045, partial [Phycisphaerales bacterium]|nr:hypothetical protein [Phycisphaerales bacterium]